MQHGPERPSRRQADAVVTCEGIAGLIRALDDDGYTVIGPTVRDGAITYDHIRSADDLPAGYSDQQEPGSYRLTRRSDNALFAYASGAYPLRHIMRPPVRRLFRVSKDGAGPLRFEAEPEAARAFALFGVRACDVEALRRLDKVWKHRAGRDRLFVAAVECGHPSSTCFCTSEGGDTRPRASYDLLITELLEGEHRFVAHAATAAGRALLDRVPHQEAGEGDVAACESVHAHASASIARRLDTKGLREHLLAQCDSGAWDEVAERCFACGNCTQVCPTCFCSTMDDTTSVCGTAAERWRRSDSCFNLSFSYIHGGSVRASVAARIRQWMLHKHAFWWDQFGTSGCVGCGRCIAWCPAAIDLTQELERIQARRTEGRCV